MHLPAGRRLRQASDEVAPWHNPSLNLVGWAVVTADAFHEAQWGFFPLEAVWMLVPGWGLVAPLRHRSPPMSY